MGWCGPRSFSWSWHWWWATSSPRVRWCGSCFGLVSAAMVRRRGDADSSLGRRCRAGSNTSSSRRTRAVDPDRGRSGRAGRLVLRGFVTLAIGSAASRRLPSGWSERPLLPRRVRRAGVCGGLRGRASEPRGARSVRHGFGDGCSQWAVARNGHGFGAGGQGHPAGRLLGCPVGGAVAPRPTGFVLGFERCDAAGVRGRIGQRSGHVSAACAVACVVRASPEPIYSVCTGRRTSDEPSPIGAYSPWAMP